MRSALLSILFVLAGAAYGQTNPHTQIRWPPNCADNNYMTYNYLSNTCILVGPVGASGQVQVNSGGAWAVVPNLTYDFASDTLHLVNLSVTNVPALNIPPTQILWPTGCNAVNQVYSRQANACIAAGPIGSSGDVQLNQSGQWGTAAGLNYNFATNTLSIPNLNVPGTSTLTLDPTHVSWPPTCSSGTYVPATNTCVPTGTAANPGGTNGQIQYNAGGTFGGLNSQGNGLLVQRSTGTTASPDCASFDANGNIVDVGTPCGAMLFSLKNGIGVWSDSIGGGTGIPLGLGWSYQLAAIGGTSVTCNGVWGGTVIGDTTYNMIAACGSATLPTDHNNRVNFMEIGTNSANGNNAPPASAVLGEEQSAVAAGLIQGTSSTSKFWFSNAGQFTLTGTWITLVPVNTAVGAGGSGYAVSDVLTLTQAGSCSCATIVVDTLGASNAIVSYHFTNYGSGYVNGNSSTSGGTGTGATINIGWFASWALTEQSASSGDSILSTSLIVGNKGAIGLVYGAYQSGGASFQVFMDGSATPLTDTVTNSATLSSNYTGHGRVGGPDVKGLTWIGAVFANITPGSHTFKVQSNSTGLFTPMFLAMPTSTSSGGGDGPNLIMSNAMPEQGNAFNVSSCLLSNAHATAANILKGAGIIGVQYVDIAGWNDKACGAAVAPTNMDTVRDFASTATAPANITNCAVSAAGIATLNAVNTFAAGTQVYIAGLTACQGINSTPTNGYNVLAAGLTGTQFQVQTALTAAIASTADTGTAALMSNNVVLNTAPPLHPSSSGQNKIAQGFAKAANLQAGANGSGPLVVTGLGSTTPAIGFTDGFGKWGVNCLTRQYGTIIGGCIGSGSLAYWFDFIKWSGSAWVPSASLDYAGNFYAAQSITANNTVIGNAFTSKGNVTLQNGVQSQQNLIFQAGATSTTVEQISFNDYNATLLWRIFLNINKGFYMQDSVNNLIRLNFMPNSLSQINSGAGANDVQINSASSSGTAGLSVYNGAATAVKVGGINGTGIVSGAAFLPNILYSAAGTALPTCNAATKGQEAVVSDATSPAYMTAYSSGGAITAAVICSFNGTTFAWLTH